MAVIIWDWYLVAMIQACLNVPAVGLLHRIHEYPQAKNTLAILIPLTKNSQKE